ncbi:LysM peptidoglycan-binding domain-containing M23 family metallopeptidase [Bacillota bacterium LX-D]|nr:LysM peptidoglycan-binding domain-containing M23 family metallopeptidase [Bacillota bacterium LX-D]
MNFMKSKIWLAALLLAVCFNSFSLLAAEAGQKLVDLWQVRMQVLRFYQIQEGDTLWGIAHQYDADIHKIMGINYLTNPKELKTGAVLIIPTNFAYTPFDAEIRNYPQSAYKIASRSYYSLEWPVTGPITSNFGKRGEEFHHGLDIGAPAGQKIRAIGDGKVIFAGWKNNIYGFAVIIDHGNGLKSLYAHASSILVKEGAWISAGQAIAKVGDTGRTTGPHLHLEIRQDGQIVNPKRYLVQR